MTKSIRIENADTSDHKVQVEVWQVGRDGEADSKLRTIDINHPTAMAEEVIHDGQYLVVKEVG